jgi:replicative DNA helicase
MLVGNVAPFQIEDLLDKDFERQVLGAMLTDEAFFRKAVGILHVDYFKTGPYHDLVAILLAHWAQYRVRPTPDVLRVAFLKGKPEDVKAVYRDILDGPHGLLRMMPDELDFAYIAHELVWFAQRSEAAELADTVAADRNQFDINAASTRLQEISRLVSTFTDYGVSLRKEWPAALRPSTAASFPTGWKDFDEAMRGGLREGELLSIMAPLKRGKSMSLINLGCRLLNMGFNVVHYTLEMYAQDVLLRYCSTLTGLETRRLLSDREVTPDGDVYSPRASLREYMESLDTRIPEGTDVIIKEFPARVATVDMLDGHLTLLEEEFKRPFVPVVDYGDLLLGPKTDEWKELAEIYTQLRNLGKRHHVPVITASQTNAGGFSADRLRAEHQSGSTRKGFVVDYLWALNQSDLDYACERFTMTPILNRNGRKDIVTYWHGHYASGRMRDITKEQWDLLGSQHAAA